MNNLEKDNHSYWDGRALGYSEVNIEELNGVQRANWTKLLVGEIENKYPSRDRKSIRILDIGAGPGFLSIILAQQGFDVTAADFSEEMLSAARNNASDIGASITFCRENAENLSFQDGLFDVVISRNLTWNLQNPDLAYKQWIRVSKDEGLLLIFDANWYSYLFDDQSRSAYEQDRKNVEASGLEDYNIGEDFDKMEAIAKCLPLTGQKRPEWDKSFLESIGVKNIDTIEDIGALVYSQKEKLNYGSTPMFMIKINKG